MYVGMYACMYVRMYVRMYVCMYVCVCACMLYIHIHIHMHMHIHIYIYIKKPLHLNREKPLAEATSCVSILLRPPPLGSNSDAGDLGGPEAKEA